MKYTLRLMFLLVLAVTACDQNETYQEMKLNHLQVIGSHNSYKIAIEKPLLWLLISKDSSASALDYAHLSIQEQLDLGLRGLELDVLYDPEGGLYQSPVGFEILDSLGLPKLEYDPDGELRNPGFKVFHIPDIDFRSHCLTFKGCLSEIREWSMSNPGHLPIFITINPKNSGVDRPGFTEVIPFDATVLAALDLEIRELFDEEELILPANVKGNEKELKTAVEKNGWPLLDAVRGKVLLVLDAGPDITNEYVSGNYYSKVMFVNVPAGHPASAFFIINDPIADEASIKDLVQRGFMVRTRADANTQEAREGDLSRFEAAKRSGAQLISTDYYLKELSPNGQFSITFQPESYSRCNPVSSQNPCEL